MTAPNMRDAAAWWAAQGVPVFPLHHPVDGACSCGNPECGSPAKHPRTRAGFLDATTDRDTIEKWWAQWPDANIGIRTGITFDLLDIDGPVGRASLSDAVKLWGGEPEAICVVDSGRADGGTHYYMQPAGRKALAGGKTSPPGIDVKGDGGYVVAPPSVHITGKRYTWRQPYGQRTGNTSWDTVYKTLSGWKKPEPPIHNPTPVIAAPASNVYGQAVLNRIVQQMRDAVSGHRWDTYATECSWDVARAIVGGKLTREEARPALEAAARDAGLTESEIRRFDELVDRNIPKVHTPIDGRPRNPNTPIVIPMHDRATVDDGWDDPDPFTHPVPAFPTWVLGWLEPSVTRLAEQMQTPVDLPAMMLLATLSATVRGRAKVDINGWTEPLNLYIVVVLGPGETKSPVLARTTEPLRQLEAEAQEAAAQHVAEVASKRRVQEGRIKRLEQAAMRTEDRSEQYELEARLATERDHLASMPEAVMPRLLVGDATPEGLVQLLAEQGGAIASLSAEGGLFDTIAGGRYSGGMANLDAVLQAHDGREPILVDRKGGDPIRVDSPCMTLGLAIQPHVLESLGGNEAARGRGFTARFLYSVPASMVGKRRMRGTGAEGGFEDFWHAIRGIDALLGGGFEDFWHAFYKRSFFSTTTTTDPLSTEEIATPETYARNPQNPRLCITLTPDAVEAHTSYRADLEPRRHPDLGDLAEMAAWSNKIDGQVLRLAGLFVLLDAAEHAAKGQPWDGQPVVTFDHMVRAVDLMEYLVEHARAAHRIMDPAGGDNAPARQLLAWAIENGHAEFTARDAREALKGRNTFRRSDDVKAAAAHLIALGYLRAVKDDKDTGGRPTITYRVNPRVMAAATGSEVHA